jgi:hypothetical protein
VDEKTQQIDCIKISLNPQYSRFVEINYALGTSRISCLKEGQPDYINIDKILEIDFPCLEKLRDKIKLLVLFS